MLLKDAITHAIAAARGSLSDLGALLRALVNGNVYAEYAGSPVGNVIPEAIGQKLLDTTNSIFYIATGLTSSDWSAIGQAATVQTAVVAVSTAELEALAATPKTLISAPGSGFMVRVVDWRVRADYGTTAMDDAAADGDLVIEYAGGTDIDTMEADGLVDATADTQGLSQFPAELITAESNLDNAAVQLTNSGAEYTSTGGDTTLEVEVRYRVIATNPS